MEPFIELLLDELLLDELLLDEELLLDVVVLPEGSTIISPDEPLVLYNTANSEQ